MLVVSEETIKGGVKVNEKREENGIPKLETYVIGLAADAQQSAEEESKVSSSNQRMRLLGTTLKPPVVSENKDFISFSYLVFCVRVHCIIHLTLLIFQSNPRIPEWPYVIGLAGGIASGKSSIAEKLKLVFLKIHSFFSK